MCGGAPPRLPSSLDQFIYAAFFATITFALLLPTSGTVFNPYPWHIWALSALAFLTAFLGKLTGHGRGISLYEPMKPGSKPEKVEFLIKWLEPLIPTVAYKSLILLLCEFLVWLGIGVAISPWLLLGAFIRPVAYHIGWGIWLYAEKREYIKRTQTEKGKSVKGIAFLPALIGTHTAIGEFLTGFFSGIILMLI